MTSCVEPEAADARCDIGRRRIDLFVSFRGGQLSRARLRDPFHKEQAVAQAEHGRDEAGQPVGHQKCVIPEPSPSGALGNDVADRLFAACRFELDLIDPLQPGAAFVAPALIQSGIQLYSAFAGHDAGTNESLSAVVVRDAVLSHGRLQQLPSMPLFRLESHHAVAGKMLEPVALTLMGWSQKADLVLRKACSMH